jgi:hypothetical protein
MKNVADQLPFYTRSRTPTAQDIAIITDMDLTADMYSLETSASTDPVTFSEIHDDGLGVAKGFRSED